MRDSAIAIAIAALAAVSGWTLRGARTVPAPTPSAAVVPAPATPSTAREPELTVMALDAPAVNTNSRRNAFAYVTHPAPVIAPVVAVSPPAPVVAAAPPPITVTPPAPATPSVPQFRYRYIGRFGPRHRSIAALTRDGDVITARTGATFDGGFVLRAIHNDALEVETAAGTSLRVPMER
jgi:hypothetical protein